MTDQKLAADDKICSLVMKVNGKVNFFAVYPLWDSYLSL